MKRGSTEAYPCSDCDYRHACCPWINEVLEKRQGCKHWKLGGCYSCIFNTDYVTDEEWFKRGCETWYPGKCKKYVKQGSLKHLLLKLLRSV